jgi:hypothetical protein
MAAPSILTVCMQHVVAPIFGRIFPTEILHRSSNHAFDCVPGLRANNLQVIQPMNLRAAGTSKFATARATSPPTAGCAAARARYLAVPWARATSLAAARDTKPWPALPRVCPRYLAAARDSSPRPALPRHGLRSFAAYRYVASPPSRAASLPPALPSRSRALSSLGPRYIAAGLGTSLQPALSPCHPLVLAAVRATSLPPAAPR